MRPTLGATQLQELKPFQLQEDVAHSTLEGLAIQQAPGPQQIQILLQAIPLAGLHAIFPWLLRPAAVHLLAALPSHIRQHLRDRIILLDLPAAHLLKAIPPFVPPRGFRR